MAGQRRPTTHQPAAAVIGGPTPPRGHSWVASGNPAHLDRLGRVFRGNAKARLSRPPRASVIGHAVRSMALGEQGDCNDSAVPQGRW
jgi:hypothetical protein